MGSIAALIIISLFIILFSGFFQLGIDNKDFRKAIASFVVVVILFLAFFIVTYGFVQNNVLDKVYDGVEYIKVNGDWIEKSIADKEEVNPPVISK